MVCELAEKVCESLADLSEAAFEVEVVEMRDATIHCARATLDQLLRLPLDWLSDAVQAIPDV
jgi:hypothetical protein